jgi:hypothetical protein
MDVDSVQQQRRRGRRHQRNNSHSVAITRRVILRAHHQTPSFLRALVNRLNNINKLLLILEHPVQLVVISRAEIAHHVLVAEEEHHRDRVVQLVHLLEIGHLVQVADVDDGEVLDAVRDLVEDFVLAHAVWVPVAPEADHYQAVFFGHDGLVDVPAGDEVGDYDGAHGGGWWVGVLAGAVGLRGYWVCHGAVVDLVQRVTSSDSFVVLD